jgi:hypothetical protein
MAHPKPQMYQEEVSVKERYLKNKMQTTLGEKGRILEMEAIKNSYN